MADRPRRRPPVRWRSSSTRRCQRETARGRCGGSSFGRIRPRGTPLPRGEASRHPAGETPDGAAGRGVCGEVAGVQGPVREIATDPEYLDVSIACWQIVGEARAYGLRPRLGRRIRPAGPVRVERGVQVPERDVVGGRGEGVVRGPTAERVNHLEAARASSVITARDVGTMTRSGIPRDRLQG